jgi:hypothetical protein
MIYYLIHKQTSQAGTKAGGRLGCQSAEKQEGYRKEACARPSGCNITLQPPRFTAFLVFTASPRNNSGAQLTIAGDTEAGDS